MRNDDDETAQARHIQHAFKQTLICSSLERSADGYVIRASKPITVPVAFRTLPDITHFRIVQENLDITALPRWTAGQIMMFLLKFPVTFEVEKVEGGVEILTLADMTAEHTVEDARRLLHYTAPRPYQSATLNYTEKVPPGLIVRADSQREQVTVAVIFQLIERRTNMHHTKLIWNMWTQEEIPTHFFSQDKRLSPFECCQEWDEPRP
jgi:hypothetical protein